MWLKGKSALVTGASRGIGRGIALKLAESGARAVCINYLSQEDATRETLEAVRQAGRTDLICQADVNRAADRVQQDSGASVPARIGVS